MTWNGKRYFLLETERGIPVFQTRKEAEVYCKKLAKRFGLRKAIGVRASGFPEDSTYLVTEPALL